MTSFLGWSWWTYVSGQAPVFQQAGLRGAVHQWLFNFPQCVGAAGSPNQREWMRQADASPGVHFDMRHPPNASSAAVDQIKSHVLIGSGASSWDKQLACALLR